MNKILLMKFDLVKKKRQLAHEKWKIDVIKIIFIIWIVLKILH